METPGESDTRDAAPRKGSRLATAIEVVSVVSILLSLAAIARRLPIEDLLGALGDWVEGLGPWGPLAFGAVYVVAVVLLVPASALTIASGAVFGPIVGTITASIASNLGAALALLIGRYLARDLVAQRLQGSPKFEAIDRAVGEGGWRVVALLRLSPLVPFNVQNYVYGITRIGFWPCVLASWAAMLPGTFLYVYLGHVGRAGIEAASGGGAGRSPAEWALIAVGLIATVVVTVYVGRLARRAMADRPDFDETTTSDRGSDDQAPTARRRWRVAILAAIAFLCAALAGVVWFAPDRLKGMLPITLGPPAVTLAEAYERSPDGPTFDHSTLDALLRRHVDRGGWVDYDALAADADRLDAYLGQLADAPFDALDRDEKLALLLNAYNACTLRLILDHRPIDSIRSIPASRRWDDVRWRIGSHTWSLNQIEHGQIRSKFVEPRVHFALVCAAIGCPPLRREAYDADRIDTQLNDQARFVHEHRRWFRFDPEAGIARLTKLYDWYGGDYEQVAGSPLAFAAGYVPELRTALDDGRTPTVRWIDYNWSLNDIANREDAP